MNKEITSETFQYSYAIFVPRKNAAIYKKYIEENLKNEGVGIISRNKHPDTCAIVIPTSKDFRKIEKDLFDLHKNSDGFWGQFGLGYKGETWTIYDN